MKKNIIIYGLIAGVVVSIPMLITVSMVCGSDQPMDFEGGMLIGYTAMIIAFSMVFVGIRNYRNKFNGGVISFGKAFKIGALIMLIASSFYVITWLIDYYVFMPDFAETYAAHTLESLKSSGASQAEIDAQSKEMASFVKMYKNPLFVILMTYMEILPVGLLITLISALILKRKVAKV